MPTLQSEFVQNDRLLLQTLTHNIFLKKKEYQWKSSNFVTNPLLHFFLKFRTLPFVFLFEYNIYANL